MTFDDCELLDELEDEARRGRIYECSLKDPRFHLDGLQDGEDIYIDPRPAVDGQLVGRGVAAERDRRRR